MKLRYMIGSFTLLVVLWQLVVVVGNYEAALLPSPKQVAQALWSLFISGLLLEHISISLYRFGIGYILAVIAGIMLGILLGRMPTVWRFVNPSVQLLRPVSPIAWSPFIVLFAGIGNLPAIIIIFIAAFFPILLATVTAVSKISPVYLQIAQNFELTPFAVVKKIIIPASFPAIMGGLQIALGSAWIFLVAGEMVGAQSGLGFLIIDARNALRLDLVFAAIIIIGLFGLLFNTIIQQISYRVTKQWGVQ
ncbi:MAG TPA: ABC transporter permease [Metalysinibacillus sp.]